MTEVSRLRGEGRWDEALELVDDPLARADLLNEQALFAGSGEARAAAERELDRAEARLLLERGRVLHARFLAERAEDPRELELFEQGLGLARASGDDALTAEGLFWVGIVHQVVRGDDETSQPFFERSYTLARELGDRKLMSYAVRHLGFVHDAGGRADEAWAAFEESLTLRRKERFFPGVAAALHTLGEVAAEQGRPDDARRLLGEARGLAEQTGSVAFLARIDASLEALP
jgi:tetratricopeptide (TPR) repeat protein